MFKTALSWSNLDVTTARMLRRRESSLAIRKVLNHGNEGFTVCRFFLLWIQGFIADQEPEKMVFRFLDFSSRIRLINELMLTNEREIQSLRTHATFVR